MKNKIIRGTFILSAAGILTRIIGFYNRIFLAGTIGAEGVGLYQMIFPVYGLCVSFAVSGIEIAISKYVAAYEAKKDTAGMYGVLKAGLTISISLSILVSSVLYLFRHTIALEMIGDVRCETLLKLAALSVPLCAVHGCIIGFFMGKSLAHIPALAQFAEQLCRVGIVYLIACLTVHEGYLSPNAAMVGLFVGELASTLVCLTALYIHSRQEKKLVHKGNTSGNPETEEKDYGKKVWRMSYPLSAGRVITSLILSSEAVLILKGLKTFGMTHADAISLYGVLTGMAMPFIFFPSTITGALASMILPSVSEAQSSGNYVKIARTTSTVVKYCFAIGTFFAVLFYFYGYDIGTFFFHNEDAGTFISILAWLCPFMYLGSTLSSILNGLGKTKITFVINVSTAISRVAALYILVPIYGIKGYLWGLLFSQIVSATCLLFFVKKYTRFQYQINECLIKPCIITVCAIVPALCLEYVIKQLFSVPLAALACGVMTACAGFFFILLMPYIKEKRTENHL